MEVRGFQNLSGVGFGKARRLGMPEPPENLTESRELDAMTLMSHKQKSRSLVESHPSLFIRDCHSLTVLPSIHTSA